MSHLMPTLSGDVSRILLFLKAIRYGRPEEILPEFLLTVKNLSFAPGGPSRSMGLPRRSVAARRRASLQYAPTTACRSNRLWACSYCPLDAQADAVRTALWPSSMPFWPCWRLSLRRCARLARRAGETSAVPGHSRVPG